MLISVFEIYIVFWRGLRSNVCQVFLALQGQSAGNELNDAPAPNRFNAVIEKIERLYTVR